MLFILAYDHMKVKKKIIIICLSCITICMSCRYIPQEIQFCQCVPFTDIFKPWYFYLRMYTFEQCYTGGIVFHTLYWSYHNMNSIVENTWIHLWRILSIIIVCSANILFCSPPFSVLSQWMNGIKKWANRICKRRFLVTQEIDIFLPQNSSQQDHKKFSPADCLKMRSLQGIKWTWWTWFVTLMSGW